MQFVPLISLHFAISIYFHRLRLGALLKMGFSKEYLSRFFPFHSSPSVMHVNLPPRARVPFVPVCVRSREIFGGEIAVARHGEGGGKKEEVDSNRFDLIVLVSVSVSREEKYIPLAG